MDDLNYIIYTYCRQNSCAFSEEQCDELIKLNNDLFDATYAKNKSGWKLHDLQNELWNYFTTFRDKVYTIVKEN